MTEQLHFHFPDKKRKRHMGVHREERLCEDSDDFQAKETGLREKQLCQHLDVGLPASRAARK